ncbi:hypothetical protein ACKI16_29595 [Streptomyces scabiei]|uniref:hypothetical protein n=1 Tax=Streptomyces scabiei TaxID=1930 RepID=UPI0038F7701C
MTSAQERWTQRILDGLGARPVGHGDPGDDDGPQVPSKSPVPPPPPGARPSPRVPDWWSTSRPNLTGTPAPAAGGDPKDDGDDEDQDDQDPPPKAAPAAAAPPPPAGPPPPPVATPAAQGGGSSGGQPDDAKRTSVRIVLGGAVEDRNARVIMFNLTAGGVGYSLGLVDILGGFLPLAEQGAVGMFGLLTATAGAVGAWRATSPPAVKNVLPVPPLSRAVIAAGAAEIGRRLAPVPVDWLNTHGERWGLGPSAISLLLTAGAMCGGLWWILDRPVRHWHWTARWLVRIPLASALLAVGLYAPGVPS